MGKEKVKRVVIDTNVIVSAPLFNGLPGKLIPMWKDGYIQPLCSKDIMDEYLLNFRESPVSVLSVSKFLKEFKL